MPRSGSTGKRPGAKWKVMAKLGENLYGTTKIYRMLAARGGTPKLKWQNFLANTSEHQTAWREWWQSKQSARWKGEKSLPTKEE